MSTFQAAFLNEVIYVTNARFKEKSKEPFPTSCLGGTASQKVEP